MMDLTASFLKFQKLTISAMMFSRPLKVQQSDLHYYSWDAKCNNSEYAASDFNADCKLVVKAENLEV